MSPENLNNVNEYYMYTIDNNYLNLQQEEYYFSGSIVTKFSSQTDFDFNGFSINLPSKILNYSPDPELPGISIITTEASYPDAFTVHSASIFKLLRMAVFESLVSFQEKIRNAFDIVNNWFIQNGGNNLNDSGISKEEFNRRLEVNEKCLLISQELLDLEDYIQIEVDKYR